MMQTVRISDAARCILLSVPKGPNLVCPWESIFSTGPPSNTALWKGALARRRDRISLVAWQGLHLSGLASARARNGHRVWEVDRLYVPIGSASSYVNSHQPLEPWDSIFMGFLEELVKEAGERRGERVIVRLPSNSPVAFQARRAGFFPYYEEILMEGQAEGHAPNETTAPSAFSRRLPQDDYGLFQLFCAATPQQVRVGLGLTFDQWRDAQEPSTQKQQEWVIRHEERITGWLSIRSHQGAHIAGLMSHPDFPEALPLLLDLALAQKGVQRWLVPEYQEMAKDLLLRRGLREGPRYTVLVKTVAAPVMKHVMAVVEA